MREKRAMSKIGLVVGAFLAIATGLTTGQVFGQAQLMSKQTSGAEAATAVPLSMTLRSAQFIRLDRPAASILIADPSIVDYQIPNADSMFLIAKEVGSTSLFVVDANNTIIRHYLLHVSHDLNELQHLLSDGIPGADIRAVSTPSGIVLEGSAPNPKDAERAVAMATSFLGEGGAIINQMTVNAPTQINIRVRIAEMDRRVANAFGINWNVAYQGSDIAITALTGRPLFNDAGQFLRSLSDSTIGGAASSVVAGGTSGRWSADAALDILADEGLVSILAEPNLTALSGETASFFSGGEFPLPVSQEDNTITVEFRRFGVLLDLVPTVLSPGRISLRVRPEVSEINSATSFENAGISIPGLRVRRTETTIELASGQSFAIAGLISSSTSVDVSQTPGLADLPILGALFRSSRFQRQETELVIIATAYTVQPNSPEQFATPIDGFVAATELERIMDGKLARSTRNNDGDQPLIQPNATADNSNKTRLLGPAGFLY